jgi:hypothetical protein
MQSNQCPDSVNRQSFLGGTMSPSDRTAVESHLAACRDCRERLIALYDNENDARFSENPPSSLKRRVTNTSGPSIPFVRRHLPLALAATLVVAIGLSFFALRNIRSTSEAPPVSDTRRSNAPTSGLMLTSPPSGAQLNAGKVEFRWTDASNSGRYEFTLTDEKGDVIAQEKPTTSSLLVDTVKLRLSSQRNYYWSVSAKLPDGTSRESEVGNFTLR